jgi:Helix-turn-helix domain
MSSPTPTQAQGEWIPKAEAAELLGVSTREIERKAASGRVRTNKVRLEGDRSDRTVYSVEDLQRVKQERESGVMQLAPRSAAVPVVQEQAFAALIAALKPPPPRVDRAWLTLEEAADYSGLTRPTISRYIRSRVVFAVGRGAKTWRILRGSLDDLGRKLGGLNPAKVPGPAS